jgi:hypothetical protein
MRLTRIELEPTRITPAMTSTVLSSTKPATAVDNPAYVLSSAMKIDASDILPSSVANPGCSTLNMAAHSLAQLPR